MMLWVLFLLLVVATPSQSAVRVLFPGAKAVVSQDRVHLVIASVSKPKVVVKEGRGARFLRSVKGKVGYYYHYLLLLKTGKNLFYVDPGGKKIVVYNRRFSQLKTRFHSRETERACLQCHTRMERSCSSCHRFERGERIYMHGPFAKGECFQCHKKGYDSGGYRFYIGARNDLELCSQCHYAPRVWQDMFYQHGPFGAKNCTACHSPHQGRYKFLLREEPKEGICLACHRKKLQELDETGYKKHPILSAKGCTVCHDPHASDYPKQLYDKPFRVCVSCHPRCKKMKRGHPVVAHPVVGPLIPGTNKRLTCTGCHNPHGSLYDALLYAPKAGNKICLMCHKYR